MATGLSDIGTKVYCKTSPAIVYSAFIAVSKIGAVGGSMDKHESTTLDDLVKTYVAGRRDTSELEFTYNFNSANAVIVKGKMDGSTSQVLMIVYPDMSGYEITGVGTDTTSDVSTNSLIGATFTFVPSAAPVWSADLTAKLPA